MSFRRRHWWTRRLVLGLAFGLLVAPAQAQTPSGPGHDDSARAAALQVVVDPSTDIPARPSTSSGSGPDGTIVDTSSVGAAQIRPDDRGERFTVTGGEVGSTADDGFAVDRQQGVTIGLSALLVALAIGLAAAFLRRPRVAL